MVKKFLNIISFQMNERRKNYSFIEGDCLLMFNVYISNDIVNEKATKMSY